MAITLIALTALLVIAGTLLEAHSESHLYATQWTYGHPLFGLLLWLFFINILFAALRRWPFKARHIPFLMTHLGLLMIIGGTILKNWYGIQGHLSILEGSGSQNIVLPHSYAIHVEKHDPSSSFQILSQDYPFSLNRPLPYKPDFLPDIEWKIAGYSPHISERIETWIKGSYAFLRGIAPISVQDWDPSKPLQIHAIHPHWDIAAIRTNQFQEAIRQAYLQNATLTILSKEKVFSFPMEEAIQSSFSIQEKAAEIFLHLPFSIIEGFVKPTLQIVLNSGIEERIRVPLKGKDALYTIVESPAWKSTSSIQLDIQRKPLLLLIEDVQGNNFWCAFDAHGRVHHELFRQIDLKNLIAYDQGFGGYAIQAQLPFFPFPIGRKEKELADRSHLAQQIRSLIERAPKLLPPLQLFKQACDQIKADFADNFLYFLHLWQTNDSLLFPEHRALNPQLEMILQKMNWSLIPLRDRQACEWICKLMEHLEISLQEGIDLVAFLERNKWPFVSQLRQFEPDKAKEVFSLLAQQLLAVTSQLPPLENKEQLSLGKQAQLLSAYLLAYGIQSHSLQTRSEDSEEKFPEEFPLTLEVPLTLQHQVETPSSKMEDNRPRILLEIKKGKQKQLISLAYDSTGTSFKWPILNGEYTVRFQPQFFEIPYRIRLRQARQINYVNSNQPFSYESDILLLDKDQNTIETTLSMNKVYETWNGYRFYLAGMSSSESGIKHVQIVVNYDPAKYYLTYPGAIIVALGCVLLFWLWPYKQRKKEKG